MYTTLISVAQLQAWQASAQPLMVFDCSFDLADPSAGAVQYHQGHIAGAVHADLDRHLCAKNQVDAASQGRHPLPSREKFANWLAAIGFEKSMQAVLYDRQGLNYCGRLWWMLKWVGHEASAVLDGGWSAWQAASGSISSAMTPARPASNYPAGPEKASLLSSENVASDLGKPRQTLLDARAAPRFRGAVEPLDPIAGHIPGALNRPFTMNLETNGFFKSAAQLRAEFTALLGARDAASVVHYCGSGVSAIANLLAMEVAGFGRSALYAGSWSAWCSDPSRPVAKG